MPTFSQIDRCFSKPVIPVFSEVPCGNDALCKASCVILQGASISELPKVLESLEQPPLDHLRLLVHIDLIPGLENNDAGLEYLAGLGKIDGVVTVHQHLTRAAKRLGMLSILRTFLSDSRALERGLKVAGSAKPDVVECLPAAAAVKVAADMKKSRIPHIAGGLCRTEADVQETIASGYLAVTSTSPKLWEINV
ncbi:glycerol-3-phosphate responsive antiterminator [Adhaeretor mobilis]|uniref:Glycerol-3-phosphate responsive antiterminator n=1 Tax=Adhaeretor mobilis TaxID=1930276 RepID=A0A517N126_9BACT|nr:glycerol-3-phosphate responsive antiterminator [Adhaeretor mobilis]QDT00827.1 Glycerol-3-phosphate responsive antiterminator [Adhaeretor mobilis]